MLHISRIAFRIFIVVVSADAWRVKECTRVVVDRKGASRIVQDSKCYYSHISEFNYDLFFCQEQILLSRSRVTRRSLVPTLMRVSKCARLFCILHR